MNLEMGAWISFDSGTVLANGSKQILIRNMDLARVAGGWTAPPSPMPIVH